jgi:ABC-2 type transport system permease protein
MWERILEIVRKEFRQVLRDPRMRTLVILPPIIQTLIFGYAVNLDVEKVRLAFLDADKTPYSSELLKAFTGSPTFQLVAAPANQREAQDLIDRGMAQAVVRVDPGFGDDLARGKQATVQVLLDGANSNTAAIVANYSSAVIGSFNRTMLQDWQRQKLVARTADGPVLLKLPGLAAERRVWFNEDLKSRNYMVPGIIVNIITLVTLMLTALSIVREKEIGTMEQIMVTPIRPIELMLGKTIPFAVLGMMDICLILSIALFIFRVPFRGNLLFLFGCATLFLLTTLGAGLFLSTISDTQQQAMMGAFFFFQPAFMLSGFAFPIRNMPEPVQWLTFLDPLRYFMEIVRGVFLKGSGLSVLWPQVVAMAVFGVTILFLSARRFHKRLD